MQQKERYRIEKEKTGAQEEALIQYFRSGCKENHRFTLGMEEEHFLTHKDKSPVSFEEVRELIEHMKGNDAPILIDGECMGYITESYSVTLEPACQVEISIFPCDRAEDAGKIYHEYRKLLDREAGQRGLLVWSMGYHPSCRAEELPLIPKKRYQIMDQYFKHTGERGIQMMRATASTQISIDYFSEEDFVLKYRAACLLTPYLSLLADNCPVWQGQSNSESCVRSRVWEDVDSDRCGILPGVMEPGFGFEAYAKEVLSRPLCVASLSGKTFEAGGSSAAEIYPENLSKENIEHILSMFFFDVRLKTYIEIRAADAMPEEYINAYGVWMENLFRSRENLTKILERYPGVNGEQIRQAVHAVQEDGTRAMVYGRDVQEELLWLLSLAAGADRETERKWSLLEDLVKNRTTIREKDPAIYREKAEAKEI